MISSQRLVPAFKAAFTFLMAALTLHSPLQGKEPMTDWPHYVRLAGGVSGHIHPAMCVAKSGAIVVIYGETDMKDLKVCRSTDQGKSWSKPVPASPTENLPIYPGSLTTLADGRIVHFWNTWYVDEKKSKSRFAQYTISTDEGVTWSDAKSLPKNPDAQSVIRHPIIEFSPTEWLCSLMDKTVVHNPDTGETKSFGDGRNHGLTPIVRTTKGTLLTGGGLRSTDLGQTWEKVDKFPAIQENGWRFDMRTLDNGWVVTQEVIGPGIGGDRWRFVVSRDDGKSWEFDHAVDFYKPGRPIGGRACPKTVQLDNQTMGTVFYDVGADQPGGPGVFFFRTPITHFQDTGRRESRD